MGPTSAHAHPPPKWFQSQKRPRKNVDQKRAWPSDIHPPSPQLTCHKKGLFKNVDQKIPHTTRGPPKESPHRAPP